MSRSGLIGLNAANALHVDVLALDASPPCDGVDACPDGRLQLGAVNEAHVRPRFDRPHVERSVTTKKMSCPNPAF